MDKEQKALEELAKKAIVSLYIGFQEMMRKEHYHQFVKMAHSKLS
jgi:hypothetical protein